VFAVHARYRHVRQRSKMLAEELQIIRLLPVVGLCEYALLELVDERTRQVLTRLDRLGHGAEPLEVTLDGATDSRVLDLHGDDVALTCHRAMHLPERRRGER